MGYLAWLALAPRLVAAQESWLDAPLAGWNQAGQAVPTAPPGNLALADPRCLQFNRPPQTPEDRAVAAAGWTLYGSYTGGWGAVVVAGLTDYDGMCRPVGYQYFAFVDGVFAGTLSPLPMAARTDGAAQDVRITVGGDITATFVRYAPDDPLCCPSRSSVLVRYRVDHTPAGPVLAPEAATLVDSP
jgi:hypothetical protein